MNTEQIQQLPLDKIKPNPDNRRVGGFDRAKLEQLADSIRVVGVQQPAVVRSIEGNGEYELVAGERRWRASKLAGLDTLPCVVRVLDDVTVLKISTIENLQREDIHPLDEAEGYSRLIDKAQYTVELLAQEVGKSISYVYQRLKLRDLVPKARDLLVKGDIAAGHAILIARLQPAQQAEVLEYVLRELKREQAISVREIDGWIQNEILMDLAKAAFKKDDATLLPEAGACTTCPKRTGHQPALFADISKKDSCTDPVCFNAKLDAMVERRRQELEGEDHLEVTNQWSSYNEDKKLPAGVKTMEKWSECKKSGEGAQRCLIVAGPDRGRITWGTERKESRSGGYEKSPQEKAAETKQKRERKIETAVRRRIWDEVIAIATRHVQENELPVEILRLVAERSWERLWDNFQKLLCDIEGWERPPLKKGQNAWDRPRWAEVGAGKIKDMDLPSLRIFLAKIALVGDTDLPQWSEGNPEALKRAAEIFGIDVKTLEVEVKERFKEKEKKPAGKKAEASGKEKKTKSPTASIKNKDNRTVGVCRVCGCTDDDCRQCIEKTGVPCHWVEPDLCSACAGEIKREENP
jgi:ParB family transcriptional regulator, chromosome partitioning protein